MKKYVSILISLLILLIIGVLCFFIFREKPTTNQDSDSPKEVNAFQNTSVTFTSKEVFDIIGNSNLWIKGSTITAVEPNHISLEYNSSKINISIENDTLYASIPLADPNYNELTSNIGALIGAIQTMYEEDINSYNETYQKVINQEITIHNIYVTKDNVQNSINVKCVINEKLQLAPTLNTYNAKTLITLNDTNYEIVAGDYRLNNISYGYSPEIYYHSICGNIINYSNTTATGIMSIYDNNQQLLGTQNILIENTKSTGFCVDFILENYTDENVKYFSFDIE